MFIIFNSLLFATVWISIAKIQHDFNTDENIYLGGVVEDPITKSLKNFKVKLKSDITEHFKFEVNVPYFVKTMSIESIDPKSGVRYYSYSLAKRSFDSSDQWVSFDTLALEPQVEPNEKIKRLDRIVARCKITFPLHITYVKS
eukprot:NODE_212_length_14557_cov_0.357103.p9 type:complete len:143 gc:universal NODE_212_length_14557_cov_0.357103:10657-10229(-)